MHNILYYIKHLDNNITDISDYIIQSDNIPVYEMNKNGEPFISEFSFTYSDTLGIILEQYDKIYIVIDGVVLFNGYIDQNVFNYKDKSRKVNVKSLYGLLQNNKLEYTNRNQVGYNDLEHSLGIMIQSTNDRNKYCLHDNQQVGKPPVGTAWLLTAFTNVSVTWVLQNIFLQIGVTLDISDLQEKSVVEYYIAGHYEDSTWIDTIDEYYTLSEILHDAESLFVVGQNKPINHTDIDWEWTLRDNCISCFDYVQIICGIFGIDIINNGFNSYKMVVRRFKTELNTNIIYDKKDKITNKAIYNGVTLNNRFANRFDYYSIPKKELSLPVDASREFRKQFIAHSRTQTNATTTIKWYDNLFFLFRKKNGNPGDVDLDKGYLCLINYEWFINKQFTNALVRNENIDEMTTDIIIDQNYKILENKVDIKNQTSTIKTIDWTI